MAGSKYDEAIAQAIVSVRRTGFVSSTWFAKKLVESFSQHKYQPERQWYKRVHVWLFGPYPRNVPRQLVDLLEQPKSSDLGTVRNAVKRLDIEEKHGKVIADFLKRARLCDLGFPIYEIFNQNALFAAALYWFAYPEQREEIDPDEVDHAKTFEGAYQLFVREVGSVSYDSRILITKVVDPRFHLLAIEISKTADGKWRVRCGPEFPSETNHITMVLTDRYERYKDVVLASLEKVWDARLPPACVFR